MFLAKIETANIYSHITPETKQEAAHKMDNLLKH